MFLVLQVFPCLVSVKPILKSGRLLKTTSVSLLVQKHCFQVSINIGKPEPTSDQLMNLEHGPKT